MVPLVALLISRLRPSRPAAPAGADEVRLLAGPEAETLARSAAVLAAIDQSAAALRLVRSGASAADPASPQALTRLALLRYGVVQFVDALEAAEGGAPDPHAVIAGVAGGEAFHRHLRAFRQQLDGCHPRMVGETEAVALLRRVQGQPVLVAVATRTRRPDRLTRAELAQMSAFVDQVRAAWAGEVEALRARLAERTRDLPPQALERLPEAPAP
jgi:hypothetical protein